MKKIIFLVSFILLLLTGCSSDNLLSGRTSNFWNSDGTYLKTTNDSGYNILVNGTSKYINFNSISGTTGYGLRDNAGTIEYKNSGGAWAGVGSGGTTDLSTAQLGQIGDVSTTTLGYGSMLRYNTGTSEWESVATSTLGFTLTESDPIWTAASTSYTTTASSTATYLTKVLTTGYILTGDTSNNAVATSVFFIAPNGYVGIGTTSPQEKLQVQNGSILVNNNASVPLTSLTGTAISARGADNSNVRIAYSSYGIAGIGAFAGRHARGTASSPSAVQNGDILTGLEGWGYGDTAYSSGARVFARGYASGTWTDASQPTYLSIWTSPASTIVPVERLRITSEGFVGIGTTSPTNALEVNGNAYVSGDLNVIGKSYLDSGTSTGIWNVNNLCFSSTGQCMSAPSITGSLISMFKHNTASEIAGYESLFTYPPTGTEVDETCVANSGVDGGYCDIDSYVSTTTDLSITSIPSGVWEVFSYGYVNSATGISKIENNYYKRSSLGVETFLGQGTSSEMNNTTVGLVQGQVVAPAFTFLPTDRLVIKTRGWTDSGTNKTIHSVYGSATHFSRTITPITVASSYGYAVKAANETITGTWNIGGSSVWNGAAVGVGYGGTGSTTLSGLLKGAGTGAVTSVIDNSANWNTAYGWGNHAGLYDTLGSATGSIAVHNAAYNHALFLVSGSIDSIAKLNSILVGEDVASTTWAGASSLITLGTVTTGSWHATTIDVDHGGTGAVTLTDHGVLIGSGTGAITPLTVGTNGQLLIGSTGADPVFATLNADRSLTATVGAGTLEIDADAELYTGEFCFTIGSSTISTTTSYNAVQIPVNMTITQASGYCKTGTTTVQFDERNATTPKTAGTDIFPIGFKFGDYVSTTTPSNATLDAGDWLNLDIDDAFTGASQCRACIKYTKDD